MSYDIQLYEMMSTTNDKFKYLEGSKNLLQYDTTYNIYWFGRFHTSSIVKEKRTKTKVILQTLNSIYIFKKVKG